MNPTEQRQRHTAAATLRATVDNLVADVMDALVDERREREQSDLDIVAGLHASTRALVGDERTDRLRLADEQRGYVDHEIRITRGLVAAFRDRSFWSRLNWLLTGR